MNGENRAVIFDRVSIVFGPEPEKALPLMDQGLERGEIQRRTGQVLGVHDCSLEVKIGEIVVLMGLSGSGKSTLLRAVNGLNPVTRGSVRVWNGERHVDVTRADAATLRRLRLNHVAMVFQQFGLLPWRTVAENVGLGLEIGGVEKRERRERVMAQLALVGLEDWADRKVAELSGGMQQRVGLARAFATEAPILLMDEPFSALDPLIRVRLQDELLELQEKLRRTIIFVSHDLDEAFRLGDRIAIMEGGRIVQSGTPAEIYTHPANAYVADFVAHMNPLGVLTAADVMEPLPQGKAAEGEDAGISPDTPLAEVMARMSAGAGPLLVFRDGAPVGRITPAGVMNRLLHPAQGNSPKD